MKKERNLKQEVHQILDSVFKEIGVRFQKNPLLLLKDLYEEADNFKRDYIGCSGIGGDCLRKQYYSIKGFPKTDESEAKNIIILGIGHLIHKVFQDTLVALYPHLASCEDTIEFAGMKGHVDIILNLFGKKIVIDIKTCRSEMFYLFLGDYEKEIYRAQILVYKEAVKAEKAFIMYINRNDIDWFIREVKDDEKLLSKTIHKAQTLQHHLDNNTEPERPYATTASALKKESKWCNFFSRCWGKKKNTEEAMVDEPIYADNKLIEEYSSLRSKIQELEEKKDMKYPEIKEINAKIAQLKEEKNKILTNTEANVMVLGDRTLKRVEKTNSPKIDEDKVTQYLKSQGLLGEFIKQDKTSYISDVRTPKKYQ